MATLRSLRRAALAALLLGTTSLAAVARADPAADLDQAKEAYDAAMEAMRAGDLPREEQLLGRAIPLVERALGPDHHNVGIAVRELGLLYAKKRDYPRAELALERAEAIFAKEGDPLAATTLADLGETYRLAGDRVRAEKAQVASLAMLGQGGADPLEKARQLNNLALTADAGGDYARAETLLLQAIALRSSALGATAPLTGESKGNLCNVYEHRGDYQRAAPLCVAALEILEATYGPRHPKVALALNNLALVSQRTGQLSAAEMLFSRVLDIYGSTPNDPMIPGALRSLGDVYVVAGDLARAEPLLVKAVAAAERILGPAHEDLGMTLSSLANVYSAQHKFAEAEAASLRSLAILEKARGRDDVMVGQVAMNAGAMYILKGDIPRAVAMHARGADIEEKHLDLLLASGSEAQKRAYAETLSGETSGILSLHAKSAPDDMAAARLAFLTVLRRKGRVLDAMTDGAAILRRHLTPEDAASFEELTRARSRLAAITLGGKAETAPGEAAALETKTQALEGAMSAKSAEFRAAAQPITIEAVQAAIPDGAALVEFVSYRPYVPAAQVATAGTVRELSNFGAERYLAYVLHHGGELAWAELGEAAPIDAAVASLRKALASQAPGARAAGRDLDERVMRPVRSKLGGATMVLLSPDSALNLVPFAALVSEDDHYLVERFLLSYLTSGRDLLRLAVRAPSRGGAVILANPDFAAKTAPSGAPASSSRAADLTHAIFPPLPGTAEEATALRAILPGSTVFTGADATESVLLAVKGPRILHVATHGFFLADGPAVDGGADSRGLDLEQGPARARIENPLLRSGLALSGANLHGEGGDAGIMTALEASGLDLFGTKLVVLSACETGLGDVKSGEGVYGLRRALVMAGSETQVMSLWKVDDAATRDLMIAYYKALESGAGRGEAMQRVQLAMFDHGASRTAHPYFWASFIVSGDPSSLEGRLTVPAPAPSVPKVEPGARGCGCELTGLRGGGIPAPLALGALVMALLATRRFRR